MLGITRAAGALSLAAATLLTVPTGAPAAKPTTGGNGKKQPTWAKAYTYQDCFEASLTATQPPGSLAEWEPSAPDPAAVLSPAPDDDDPGAGGTSPTNEVFTTQPIFEATPPLLLGYKESDDDGECSDTSTSSAATGTLTAGTAWTAMDTQPTEEGAASGGAGVWRLISVRGSYTTLKATAVFSTAAGALAATASPGSYSDVVGHLIVRPICDPACPTSWDSIVLARNNLRGYAEVAPGDHRVTLTLTAPAGQTLPQGYYQLTQLLSGWASGTRVDGSAASARGTVLAKGITVTLS